MPVQTLEEWAVSRIQTSPLSALKDAVIGVEASHYLHLHLGKSSREPEPLLPAVGGLPYRLRKHIEDDIELLKKNNISLVFVFDGLDFRNKTQPLSHLEANRKAHEDGWMNYLNHDPTQTVESFKRATYPVETLYKYLQRILFNHEIQFIVAPYSAAAQLSYLKKQPEQFIDCVLGSADCFLFSIDKIITGINIENENGSFCWLSKVACQERLDRASEDDFRDAQLLLGSAYLPTFPVLGRSNQRDRTNIRDSLNLLRASGKSVIQLCHQNRDDAQVKQLEYADRYKKAIMTLRHHVVLETAGRVLPMDLEHAPGDVHEFVGQRLPEELYFYISKGMLGTQVPDWLTTGEVVLSLPSGCADTAPYRRLMREALNPVRTQAIGLLSNNLNWYYQKKSVQLKLWYESNNTDQTVNLKELPSIEAKISGWKVGEDTLPGAIRSSQDDCSFLLALNAVLEQDFPKDTAMKSARPLRTRQEIMYNVIWSFLQLRGFIDENRQLTGWGIALSAAISALDSVDKFEDIIFVAIEMLRMGFVNGQDLLTVPGGAVEGSGDEKIMTNLVSRIACLGRLKQKAATYSGPLDRQLLSYYFMISAVRASLRNLVETILVSMFLGGAIDRDRSDWEELGLSLPFLDDNGTGLGVATSTYLDAVVKAKDEDKDNVKRQFRGQEDPFRWFSFVPNMSRALDDAFKLWDAVYTGAQAAGKEFNDIKTLEKTNEWLGHMR